MRDKHHHQDARISAIEGRRYVRKPTYYLNLENGNEYYAIAGSIAFPIGKMPGFGTIVGVLKETEHKKAPHLQVLEEIEEPTLVGLLSSCEQARWKWGYPSQLDLWIGDAEHFMQAIAEFNDDIESMPDDRYQGLYISPPSDFEETRRDELYLQTVRQLLSPGPCGVKRLIVGSNPKLRAYLQNVPPDLGHVEDVPALAALAYAAHTILATMPWLQFTQPERFEPTIKEDGYAQLSMLPWEDEHFQWDELDSDLDGNPLDDGELTGTI
jgi:hypothetical protein